MVNVPVTSSFVLTTTSGSVFNDGVSGNFANGNDVVTMTTSSTTPNTLEYDDSTAAVTGGNIAIADDASFSKTFVGLRPTFGGPFQRFNTAYFGSAQVFI
jgi:hypothetical protein